MLAATEALTAEELTRDLKSSFPSVRDTLVHIMGGEWVWLTRWQGGSPTAMPGPWQALDLAGIRAQWQRMAGERAAFLASVDEAGLERPVRYRTFAGAEHTAPLGELIRHVVNHSTYHRGQVVTLLRQLGAAAPATDLVAFQRERRVELGVSA